MDHQVVGALAIGKMLHNSLRERFERASGLSLDDPAVQRFLVDTKSTQDAIVRSMIDMEIYVDGMAELAKQHFGD